jgi:transcriptional regulator with XRE-family HTH domain
LVKFLEPRRFYRTYEVVRAEFNYSEIYPNQFCNSLNYVLLRMNLAQKIATARHALGLTQEELANRANITVRTVQRLETGESVPRTFTIKALASALQMSFEELNATSNPATNEHPIATDQADTAHFLQLCCLSCFSFIVIPYVHFLIPHHLLKKEKQLNPSASAFAKQMIRQQIYWVISFHLLLLVTLALNFLISYFNGTFFIYYLWIVLLLYLLNIVIILSRLVKIRQLFG